ncbi:MAG TPA: hypothetical protein VHU92_23075 [Streptosporangiaceae bacterium]|nr:hypothetical protein [Streptosporangiaceae bacterium]
MTPTEELLASMLADEATAITPASLRPLNEPARESRRSRIARWRATGFRVAIPVAAAAAVLLVAGLMVAARSLFAVAPPFADVGTRTSPPPYYVEIDANDKVIVQSTATGRRTDAVTPPAWVHGNSSEDAALAVSADGRTFIAAYNDWDSLRTNLFRFTLTGSGQVVGFAGIRTGPLPGLTEPSLAISPDGTQIALAGIPDKSRSIQASSGPPRLVVADLRTGRVRTWPGLAGTGATDSIQDPVWMTDETLRFLVGTCRGYRDVPYNVGCAYAGPAGREWTLDVPRGRAALGAGRVLVTLPGVTAQALSGRGTGSQGVTSLEPLRAGGIQIARYDVRTGRLLKILYRGRGAWKSNYLYAGLAADSSGNHLLISEDLGTFFGWLGDQRFHRLPIRDLYGGNEAVAATW